MITSAFPCSDPRSIVLKVLSDLLSVYQCTVTYGRYPPILLFALILEHRIPGMLLRNLSNLNAPERYLSSVLILLSFETVLCRPVKARWSVEKI